MSDIDKIRDLNDLLRQTFATGKIVLSNKVQALEPDIKETVLTNVRCYDDFKSDFGQSSERDFGAFDVEGISYFWKIDYYDTDLEFLSTDPANPQATRRVLTIMRADEY